MPAENRNHPEDHAAIERLHQHYVGKIKRFSDDLMAFQGTKGDRPQFWSIYNRPVA